MTCESKDGICGTNVGGQTGFFHRLVFGYAPELEPALVKAGKDPKGVKAALNEIRKVTELTGLVWDAMPVQDAIDFAEFIVDGTKRLVRFLPGHDTVAGEIDIDVITKKEVFKWVRRHYYPPALNP